MNCFKVCNGCLHQIIILKVDRIRTKCKFKTNNYIYKFGSPMKCIKFKLKNNKNIKTI